MKVGKVIDNEMQLIECELGFEVGGSRTVEELYADGYKNVCEVAAPSESATCTYKEYDTFYMQIWHEEEVIDPDEITDEEALNIITEGV